MQEKLAFKDVKNLKIQGLNADTQELEVQLLPDQDLIFVIRKTGASNEAASYKLASYTRVLYESVLSLQEFYDKGKKTQITED